MGFSIFLVICRIFCCGMLTLSCGKWDLVPWQGIKPGPLHSECRVLTTGPLGKSQRVRILKSKQSSNPCFGLLRLGSPSSGWATCYSTMPFPCLQSGLLCIVSTDFYNKSEKKKKTHRVKWPPDLSSTYIRPVFLHLKWVKIIFPL